MLLFSPPALRQRNGIISSFKYRVQRVSPGPSQFGEFNQSVGNGTSAQEARQTITLTGLEEYSVYNVQIASCVLVTEREECSSYSSNIVFTTLAAGKDYWGCASELLFCSENVLVAERNSPTHRLDGTLASRCFWILSDTGNFMLKRTASVC